MQLGRLVYLLVMMLLGLGMVLLGRRLGIVTLRKELLEIGGVFLWASGRESYHRDEAEDSDSWDPLEIYQIAGRESG